jgi:pimeloyl-ACP methyl ester carboxylesterase
MPVAADLYYHAHHETETNRLPVVLLHGAGGTHLYWPSEVRRLGGYRVLAPDLPGHGKSGGRGQQSIAAYSQAVLDWLEAVGLHQAVFVGHSMGSAIVLTLAVESAEHVLGIGLVGAGARLQVSPALLEAASSPTTYHQALDLAVTWSFGPRAPVELITLAARRMAETRQSVLYGDFLACDGFDLTERVGEITRPALVLCGAEDKMTPLRNSQFLAGAIPDARLEVIPNAGHMVMLENPPAVANALADFLSTIPY